MTISTPASSTTYTANYTRSPSPISATCRSSARQRMVGGRSNAIAATASRERPTAADHDPGHDLRQGLGRSLDVAGRVQPGGTYTTFLADLGIDDETNGGGSVVFQSCSPTALRSTRAARPRAHGVLQCDNLNVTGVNQLQLNVNQSTNGKTDDHADWANARLLSTRRHRRQPPSDLTATALSTTQIRLNWTDNANNETGFQIDRSPNGTSGWTQIATVGSQRRRRTRTPV